MKFHTNGPDIPIELIRALEEDKLVFFCGAGVSYLESRPAFGSFDTLLSEVTQQLNFTDKSIFEFEIEIAFETLEREFGKKTVEDSIRRILTLDGSFTGALQQHEIVLRLSRSIARTSPRLITTNFDNCFDRAWQACGLPETIIHHSANAVPVPNSVWSSIVYLHGKADIPYSELVYSRTDFAKAYFGNRWATSFLMELFQEYTVVFLGYSMRDPIMRYGVQALRPERKPYILIQNMKQLEVHGLNLQTLPFFNYKGLWETLNRWAEMHEQGKDGWITYAEAELVNAYPTGMDIAPESMVAVTNLTQILCDPSRAYALSNSMPIEWLETFQRIDTEADLKKDNFNVLQPDNDSIPVCSYGRIANVFPDSRPLHPVTKAIGEWMINNIAKDNVLKYIVESGCILHLDIAYRFKNAIKGPPQNSMSTIQRQAWELVLFHSSPPQFMLEYMGSIDIVPTEGFMQMSFKQFLLKQLKPRLEIKRPYSYSSEHESLSSLLNIDIKISAYHGYQLSDFKPSGLLYKLQNEHPQVLSSLFEPLEAYLQEVVRLSALFQDEYLLSVEQNIYTESDIQDSGKWTIILNWFWRAFDTIVKEKQESSISRWSKENSLLFRRIALQAYNRIRGLEHDS
jgi:hypothetical protein